MRSPRSLAVMVLGAATVAVSVVAAPGSAAAPASPSIIGGSPVSSAPWAAAVYRSGSFTCSGTIIAPQWVMTARHCVGSGLTVRVGNVYRASGTPANVTSYSNSPYGDISLLRLDRSISTSYSPLASTNPAVGATNNIYGWGRTSYNGAASAQLKTATVRVTSTSCGDAYGGRAICSTGISGVAWRGDSGGPQFSGGLQVGVASTANGSTTQQYASVAASRSWIRSVSGV